MCGLFGLIRNTRAAAPDRASVALVALGRLAVSRGRDAAGLAFVHPAAAADTVPTRPTRTQVESTDETVGHIRVVKDTCSFDDLWGDDTHLAALHQARVTIGHTRWATQGDRKALTNASPLLVGNLVGTHNGDVDTASLKGAWAYAHTHGSTDTERLYQSLDGARRDRRKVTATLADTEGRAALAWVDRAFPDRVYLARAALSPLAVAWDADGNMYWASNPDWFRQVDETHNHGLGFHDITLVREGTLVTVDLHGPRPAIADVREFMPRARYSDEAIADLVVWRGFTSDDRDADQRQAHHEVAKERAWVERPRRTRLQGYSASKGRFAAAQPLPESAALDMLPMSAPWSFPDPHTTAAPVDTAPVALPGLPAVLTSTGAASPSSAEGEAKDGQREDDWDDDWEDDLDDLDDDRDREAGVVPVPAGASPAEADEALTAAMEWADKGMNPLVPRALSAARTPAERTGLLRDYRLSSAAALDLFEYYVGEWEQMTNSSPTGSGNAVPA